MSYCDVKLVRALTGLDTGEIRDQRIRDLRDDVATSRLNSDIQTRIDRETVRSISSEKSNSVDGENTVFYLRAPHDSFRELGDLNDDGVVDENDIVVWSNDEDKEVVVTNVLDAEKGKFEAKLRVEDDSFEPIPQGTSFYVRYRHAPVSVAEPNQNVAVACAQLTGAFCFSNIETSKLKNFSIGDVTIRKQTEGFGIMMDQYNESRRRLVNRELIEFGDNVNEIGDVIRRKSFNDRPLGGGKNVSGGFT